MPELPDLLYIRDYLQQTVEGALSNATIQEVAIRGPFIRIELSGKIDVVAHLMLK